MRNVPEVVRDRNKLAIIRKTVRCKGYIIIAVVLHLLSDGVHRDQESDKCFILVGSVARNLVPVLRYTDFICASRSFHGVT